MPDDELWRAALDGSLRSADVLDKQVRRMLRDAKAQALVENFAGQWLQLRNLRAFNPDRGRFPSFDDKLRDAMIRETELFFGAVMRGDSSILDFIDSDFTYLNEQLARHYGISGVKGEQFRRVKLKAHERGGLVTQASILTVTSNPTRTSPVKRGKWVLEQLLGTPPPPPPPNVPVLTEDAKALTAATCACGWSSIARKQAVRCATTSWTHLDSVWRISTRSAHGAARTVAERLILRARCLQGNRFAGPKS